MDLKKNISFFVKIYMMMLNTAGTLASFVLHYLEPSAPPRKVSVVKGQMTEASNIRVRPPSHSSPLVLVLVVLSFISPRDHGWGVDIIGSPGISWCHIMDQQMDESIN